MKACPHPYRLYIISVVFIINISLPDVLANLYQFKTTHNKLNVKKLAEIRRKRETPVKYAGDLDNLRGKSGEGYYLQVEIGNPKQKLNVLIDTGSSNFAVACAANKDITSYFQREQSSSFKSLGRDVNVPYTQGSWNGILGQDYVTITSLPNSTVLANIACITQSEGFFINGSNWQGIMGLGYADIARPDSSVVPLYDSMVQAHLVDNFYSVELCGLRWSPNSDDILGGSILFGGSDPSLYTGALYPTPINKECYYEVIIVDIAVAGDSLDMDCKEYNFGKTIVDTGTTNLRLPSRVFNKLLTKMKRIVKSSMVIASEGFWSGDENLCWRSGLVPYSDFPTISITLPTNKTTVFTLNVAPQQYLRQVGEGNSTDDECFKLAISSLDSGSVIGAVLMEGYYVLFDRELKQIKFGESTCNVSNSHNTKSTIQGNIPYTGDYKDCAYIVTDTSDRKTLTIVGYVLIGVCGVCLLPLFFLIVLWQWRKCRFGRTRVERSNSDLNDLVDSS